MKHFFRNIIAIFVYAFAIYLFSLGVFWQFFVVLNFLGLIRIRWERSDDVKAVKIPKSTPKEIIENPPDLWYVFY